MKQSESIAKISAALVAAQAELRAIGKDSTNPHFKSKFASLDNTIETIRPTLAAHKLAVLQGTTTPESDANAKLTGFSVETMLVHESGEWICSSVVMPIGKVDPQGAGAALTYGRRYGLSALLCLATDEDNDGDAQRSGGRGTGGGQSAPRQERPTSGTDHTRSNASGTTQASPGDVVKPFGKGKGTAIKDLDPADLVSAVEWAKANKPEPYAEFIKAAESYTRAVA